MWYTLIKRTSGVIFTKFFWGAVTDDVGCGEIATYRLLLKRLLLVRLKWYLISLPSASTDPKIIFPPKQKLV
jgi:hypothetical protein